MIIRPRKPLPDNIDPNVYYETYCNRLEIKRKELKLQKRDMARFFGVSPKTYGRWVNQRFGEEYFIANYIPSVIPTPYEVLIDRWLATGIAPNEKQIEAAHDKTLQYRNGQSMRALRIKINAIMDSLSDHPSRL